MRARTNGRLRVGCAATVVVLAAITTCGGVSGLVWLRTGGADAWLAAVLERAGSAATRGGRVEVGALDLSASGITVDEVTLYDASGKALAVADHLEANVEWSALLSREIHVRALRGEGGALDLGVDATGTLDLVRLFSDPNAPPLEEAFRVPVAFRIDQMDLTGLEVVYHTPDGTVAAGEVAVHAQVLGRDDRVAVTDLQVTGVLVAPSAATMRASGALAYDGAGLHVADLAVQVPREADVAAASMVANGSWGDAVDLAIRVTALDLDNLEPLLGAGLGGQWTGDVQVAGAPDRLGVTASMSGADVGSGSATVTAELDTSRSPVKWEARAELHGVHAHTLLPALTESVVLSGDASLVGTGISLASDLTVDGSWTGGRQQLYGYDVNAVDARFRVADGTLYLDNALLDGIIGAIRLDGTIALEGGPVRLRVSGPLDAAMLAARGVTGVAGDGAIDAVVETDLQQPDAPVTVKGTVTYAPFLYTSLNASRLSAPFDVTVHGGSVDGTVAIDGSGVSAAGWTADAVRSDGLTFHNVHDLTELDGVLQLDGLVYPDTLSAVSATGPLTVRVEDAHTAVRASFEVGPHAVLGFAGTRGSVDADLLDERLDLRVWLQDGLRTTLGLEGTYDLDRSAMVLDTFETSPTVRARWVATRPVALTLVNGGVADADLALASPLGRVEVSGRLANEGTVDGRIAAQDLQIDYLAELFPDRFGALGGALTGSARWTGPAADPTMTADVHLQGLNIEGTVRSMDVDGTLTLEDGVLTPRLAVAAAHVPLAQIDGAVPVRGGLAAPDLDWDARGTLSIGVFPGAVHRVRHLTPLADELGLPEGKFSGAFTISGPLRDPEMRLAGVLEAEVAGWDRPGRLELSMNRRGEALTAQLDLRRDVYRAATVDATARTRIGELFGALAAGRALPSPDPALLADELDARARLDRLPAAQIGALTGRTVDLHGSVSGTVAVSGSPMAPVASSQLQWNDGAVGRQPIDAASISLTPRTDGPGYELHLALADPGGSFSADGVVPVQVDLTKHMRDWPAGELSIDVAGDLPLALLEAGAPDLREAEGRLAIAGHIGGALLSPSADLTATIDGGRIAYRGLGVQASDLVLSLGVTNQTLVLHRAAAILTPYRPRTLAGAVNNPAGMVREGTDRPEGRPRIIASGRADLGEGGDVRLDGEVRLDEGPWLWATDDATLRANGNLRVDGIFPALRVRGDLEVVQGSATIDTAELAQTAPLVLDPSILVSRQQVKGQPPLRPAPAPPPAYAAFDVDVTLDLQRNLELAMSVPVFDQLGRIGADLTSTDITARLGGQLSMRLERGRPTLIGQVELLDGQVRMLRSTFDLERGTITWAGGDPYEDATLDIHAVANVPGGSLSLTLTGTAAEPDPPVLSSEEYPDPNQQMAILLTGRAPEDLTSLEGAAELLAQAVFSNVVGGRSLGTISFEPDGSVRIGVPVTPTFHAATLFCPLCTDPESNQLTIEGEWSILPRLVLSGAYGNNTSWGDVFWEVRF